MLLCVCPYKTEREVIFCAHLDFSEKISLHDHCHSFSLSSHDNDEEELLTYESNVSTDPLLHFLGEGRGWGEWGS